MVPMMPTRRKIKLRPGRWLAPPSPRASSVLHCLPLVPGHLLRRSRPPVTSSRPRNEGKEGGRPPINATAAEKPFRERAPTSVSDWRPIVPPTTDNGDQSSSSLSLSPVLSLFYPEDSSVHAARLLNTTGSTPAKRTASGVTSGGENLSEAATSSGGGRRKNPSFSVFLALARRRRNQMAADTTAPLVGWLSFRQELTMWRPPPRQILVRADQHSGRP